MNRKSLKLITCKFSLKKQTNNRMMFPDYIFVFAFLQFSIFIRFACVFPFPQENVDTTRGHREHSKEITQMNGENMVH
jgi:hypothetical protein